MLSGLWCQAAGGVSAVHILLPDLLVHFLSLEQFVFLEVMASHVLAPTYLISSSSALYHYKQTWLEAWSLPHCLPIL